MYDEIFVLTLGFSFILLFAWAFKALPQEDWQILAIVPLTKTGVQNWQGLNLTYYGLFIAFATVVALSTLLVLLSAIHIPISAILSISAFTLLIGLIASKFFAALVEKKPHTFTIAGAFFAGFFTLPPIVLVFDRFVLAESNRLPMIPILASFGIAYAIGEGLGRLACISFGCCYGKLFSDCHPIFRRFLGKYCFVFNGKLKKIAYESGLDGKRVVPVQAITALLYVTVGLITTFVFLKGHYSTALIVTIFFTQSWRVLSETLRADYRGDGNLTAYQIMALVSIPYVLFINFLFVDACSPAANVKNGLITLWDPMVFLFIQIVGLTTFVFTGRSMVTSSTISFHIVTERI
ncbi:MAG: prolipoprotein diacylglyceryl transferase family protein [Desulfomonilaceae bacterium]